MNNRFYTVEGIDGCGKTSACNFMSKYLTEKKVPHRIVAAYPKDESSMVLRNLWISQALPPVAEAAIIIELRRRQLENVIIPALLDGEVVISDRYHDSTYVYQNVGRGVSRDLISRMIREQLRCVEALKYSRNKEKEEVYRQLTEFKTIHLDVTLENSRRRINARGNLDAFEKKGDDFFARLIKGYRLEYSRSIRDGRVDFIDANQSLDKMYEELTKYFQSECLF